MESNNNNRLYNMSEAVRELNINLGRNQLYEFLKEKNVIEYNNAPNIEFINKGYFVYKSVKKHVKKSHFYRQFACTLVTKKGLDFIRKLYEETKNSPNFLSPTNPLSYAIV